MKTAIILGATGLTGSIVLEKLLLNDAYEKIILFSRNPTGINHEKVKEHIVDLLNLEAVQNDFHADEVYCCIGTTKKKTPDQDAYISIDFGIPVATAKLCKQNGIKCLSIISAIGANPNSSIFYNRTKGEMEQAVLSYGIERTYIFRPSFIGGNRSEKRVGERIGLVIFNFLKPLFIGKMKKYAVINASDIANRMIQAANSNGPSRIFESNEI